MFAFIDQVFTSFWHDKSGWELIAVALGIAYLVLAMRQNIWCWICAFISTAIYTWLFWHVSLFMESMLNVYYMVMAGVGLWMWRKQDALEDNTLITYWPLKNHIAVIGGVILISLVSGYLLAKNTSEAWPYLDSFTTWGAVITTIMVARKVMENWIYWLVIDAVGLFLFIERGLYPTAMLWAIYLVLVVFGWFSWKKSYTQQQIALAEKGLI
jgi:nicotinamide mononucleotide transporter